MEALKYYWNNNSEELIQNLINENSIYSISDSFGRIEYVNNKFCDILECNIHELIGENHKLLKSELHASFKYKNLWNTIQKGMVWQGVLKDKTKKGTSFWLDTTIIPIKNKDENNLKYLCIYNDITKIKSKSDKIEEDEAFYRSIYNSSDVEIIITTDDNGIITKWNKGANIAFGFTELEMIGTSLKGLMANRYKKRNLSEFLKLINRFKKSQNTEIVELNCINKNGEEFPVEFIIKNWYINEKESYIIKMLDITKRQAFQRRLKLKTKELELFLYRAAHEIKGPFSSAKGLISLLKEEESIDKVHVLAELLEETLNNAKILSEDLASASLISTNLHELKIVNFNEIVGQVLNILNGYKNSKNIKFNIDIKDSGDFLSNPDLIFSIFQNLIKNSIKYSLPFSENHVPKIDIKVRSLNEEIVILICDNGKGIGDKEIDKIFDLYYRTDNENGNVSAGLGLYIVKNIIESLNGRISVSSEKNNGACFKINLPNNLKLR